MTSTTAAPVTKDLGRTSHRRTSPGRVLAWVAMIGFLILTLFPFYWMLRTALSTTRSLPSGASSLLPVDFTWGAFERVLGLGTKAQAVAEGGSGASVNFWLYLRNSVIYAGAVTLGQVFFCGMAAYAFARLRWPGRNLVFGIFLGALLVPPIFTSLPNFILVKNLGLLNTLPGMILPSFLMTPFAIFFLRQFFLGISREIEESASLDGAGPWRTFFQIVLPMSTAPVTTLAILTFIGTWNDYFWPLLVANSEQTKVLTVAGSAAAQDLVGASGVVFPAIPSGTDAAGKAFGAKNIDVNSSFLVHIKDGTTFLFPITDHASQVTGIMNPAVDAVFTGKAKADSLTAANNQVNALFS